MNSENLLTTIDGGIQAVLPLAASPQPQTVYLDFDGAVASYHNRDLDISIGDVAIAPSGFGDGDIAAIVASLNGRFDDVVFTSSIPSDGEFSTIYVGVTSAFDDYGTFYGLAETIDSGNHIHDDNAFVLLDSSASAELVVSVIAHETEHIVHGMDHGGDGLQRFATDITVVESGDTLTISGGPYSAVVYGTMIIGGMGRTYYTIISGGTMSAMGGGGHKGEAHNTTISGGSMFVAYSGYVDGTIIYDGCMRVSTTAYDTTISGGTMLLRKGTAEYTELYGGSMVVHGGTAYKNTVRGGTMTVESGGVASNTTMWGGTMVVSSGCTICGSLSISPEAVVSACAGAVCANEEIEFRLSWEPNSNVLIDHYDFFSGAADAAYMLEVAFDSEAGRYALASHAPDFNSTITVKTADADIGEISVGEMLKDSGKLYRLVLDVADTLWLKFATTVQTVTNPDAGGEESFDEAATGGGAILFQSSTSPTIYNYTDGLAAAQAMDVVGNGTSATTLSGGSLYLDGNEASFSELTLDGFVFGGGSSADCGDVSLSFDGVEFSDGNRIYGGADVAGGTMATVGDISLSMRNVNGSGARVFGAGRVEDDATLTVENIDIRFSCADGGSLVNLFAGADVAEEFEGAIICGTVNTVIDGGEFTYCGNGSQLRGGESTQLGATLTINGGVFKHYVYAGGFSAGGSVKVTGDTSLIINGGTFKAHVFGGCGAKDSDSGDYTSISGAAGVVVNATDETISFDGNIYAGSMGDGYVNGGTTMTFTGDGSKLSFKEDSYVTGYSQMYKFDTQLVDDCDHTLVFDGFSGNFSANINNGFTKLAASGSNVAFTGGHVALGSISEWEVEVGSTDAELDLGYARNSFKGDSLTIAFTKKVATQLRSGTPDDALDVIAGKSIALRGWTEFSSVSIRDEVATFADGEWRTENYRLFRESDTLKLAALAET